MNSVKWFGKLDASVTGNWEVESWKFVVDSELAVPVRDPAFFAYSPFEHYASWGLKNQYLRISAGQKYIPFSEMDKKWEIGLWHPRKRIDPFQTKEQGLLGVFGESHYDVFSLEAFISPVSLPEVGVPSEIRDGKFFSPYPMYSAPSSEIEVFGVSTPVRYQIDDTNIWSFLKRDSLNWGTTLGVGNSTKGGFVRGSYTYQTIPQILVGFTGGLGQGGPLKEARVKLYPRRVDHRLIGTEAGWATPITRTVLSFTDEEVFRDKTPSDWNTQEVALHSTYLAFSQDFNLLGSESQNEKEAHFELMGFRHIGTDPSDQGPLLTGKGNLFDPRSPYQTALSGKIRYSFLVGGKKLNLSHRWIRDFVGLSDGWFTFAGFDFSQSLRFWASMDFLRTLKSDETNDIISIYREQDRMSFGVQYVF